jgi:hypothetical protein
MKPIITLVVYRLSLSRRLTALEKKLGISPEERHEVDPFTNPEKVHLTGIRLRNTPNTQDRKTTGQEPSHDTPVKVMQGVLSFPVIKPATRVKQVANAAIGALGVRMFCYDCPVRS